MTTIALPERKIILPPFEFPRWLRLPRGVSDERAMLMPQIATGGIHGGLNAGAVGVAQGVAPHWSTANGEIAAAHIAAWTPKGAASLAASYVNYGTLCSGVTVGTAPNWDATNGWTPSSSSYLRTGLVPTNQQWSILARFSNATTTAQCPAGQLETGAVIGLMSRSRATNTIMDAWVSGNTTISSTSAAGVVGLAGLKTYWDGSNKSTATATAGTLTKEIYLCACNYGGSGNWYISTMYVQAVAIYDIVLTDAQVTTISVAMAAL